MIVKVQNENSELCQEILDTIEFIEDSGIDLLPHYNPFVLFLINEPKNVIINGNNEKRLPKIVPVPESSLDPMKIETLLYADDEEKQLKDVAYIQNKLKRFCSYFNQLGDKFYIPQEKNEPILYELVDCNFPAYINIFCIGQSGKGKSTFINKFFEEKRAKEGGNKLSTSTEIIKYHVNNYPIRIYDTPGFEDDKTCEEVYEQIRKQILEIERIKEKVHLVLYFLQAETETNFYKMERNIIEALRVGKAKLIFISNFSNANPSIPEHKEDCLKQIRKYNDLIEREFHLKNYLDTKNVNQENIVLCNLVKGDILRGGIPEFGFSQIIKTIFSSLNKGNPFYFLKEFFKFTSGDFALVLSDAEIEELCKKNFYLESYSFSVLKEKLRIEALNLVEEYFGFGRRLLSSLPGVSIVTNQVFQYQIIKKISEIYGFNITDEDVEKKIKELKEKQNKNYYEAKEEEKEIKEKLHICETYRKSINKIKGSKFILLSNVLGTAACAVGFVVLGPVLVGCAFGSSLFFQVGAHLTLKASILIIIQSYDLFFEKYKHFALVNFVIALQEGLKYLYEKYYKIKEKNEEDIGYDLKDALKNLILPNQFIKNNGALPEEQKIKIFINVDGEKISLEAQKSMTVDICLVKLYCENPNKALINKISGVRLNNIDLDLSKSLDENQVKENDTLNTIISK